MTVLAAAWLQGHKSLKRSNTTELTSSQRARDKLATIWEQPNTSLILISPKSEQEDEASNGTSAAHAPPALP